MDLHERWNALCARIGQPECLEQSGLAYDMIASMYEHPPRAYHNMEHVAWCLRVFDDVRGLADAPDDVEFSIWLHDSIFFPTRPDNEARSADAAGMIAALLGCEPETIASLKGLVLATRHSDPSERPDERLIADIDLSILGAESADYAAYSSAIRDEFGFASDDMYASGRITFLNRMLDKSVIYSTPYFRSMLEAVARRNIEAELETLRGW